MANRGNRLAALGKARDRLTRSWITRNLVFAAAIVLLLLPLAGTRAVQFVDGRIFDGFVTLWPVRPATPSAVVVAIDEPSFAEMGERWPWPRERHAQLVKALRAAGAKSVVLDLVFSEASNPASDAALAAALGPDTILAATEEVLPLDQGTQIVRVTPLPELLSGGPPVGDALLPLDPDGVIRRMPDPADALAAVTARATGHAIGPMPAGALIQPFGPPRSYPTLSYYQALDPGRFLPPGRLAGTTVFVGLSLSSPPLVESGGTDAFQTPFTMLSRQLTAGVELHATIHDNWVHDLWIRAAPQPFVLAASILTALAAALVAGARTTLRGVLAVAGLVATTVVASYLLLRFGRVWLCPTVPSATALGTASAAFTLDYAIERRLRRAVSKAFSRYVSPDLVSELVRDPSALRLGGELREISVLFCDVRGFTSLAEDMKDDPERLTALINRLLDALSDEVLQEQGTIDKYMGDCVMAFWNAPLAAPDHAAAAVRAAVRMGERVRRLNDELGLSASDGTPRLDVGVGVNTGRCVVGNIGSRWRYDYSVLGDAVNLASRLEGTTKDYAVPLVIGPETAAAVQHEQILLPLGEITVRGRQVPTSIFTVLAPRSAADDPRVREVLAQFEALVAACRGGHAVAAAAAAVRCADLWPPLADCFLRLGRLEAPGPGSANSE